MTHFNREPQIRIDRENDKIVSVYVQLRDGVKAVGTIQPNPSALVFFLIAKDGLPIGIRLLEPVTGVAVCEILDTLVEGPDGPEGVTRQAQPHFVTDLDDWKRLVKAFRAGLAELQSS